MGTKSIQLIHDINGHITPNTKAVSAKRPRTKDW